ncbi:MAG: MOSC N-terminal beta barrel domain-containing protein [Calothrix sp. C42_A2020_038]|nr:MOSC N-terminal beta barrel domain-containing protein [Calothrix sp. C42_A2020_038]
MNNIVPYVSKLFIYPIKALDRVEVDCATILKSGALQYDREFAMVDNLGNFVNGKRNQHVHAIRSRFNLDANTVCLSLPKVCEATFHLQNERAILENRLSEYFGFPIYITQNLDMGFPDDTVSPGPTIISTATLEAIASWYPELDVEEVRLRFRSNIEISGVPAFWEDCLFAEPEQTVDFQIGNVKFIGVNPCQRCVVVTRNSQTGEQLPNFQKTFVAKRRQTLPQWVNKSHFNHFYRLAVNTRVPSSEEGKTISIGDVVYVKSYTVFS